MAYGANTQPRRTALLFATLTGATLLASVGLRQWMAHAFPTRPISDFRGIVDFAHAISEQGPAAGGEFLWNLLNPGAPTLLSLFMRAFPGDVEDVARTTTALMVGLVPLLAVLLLRDVLPAWGKLLCAAVLAFQPAQLVFSGVVAQDNWILAPAVALACLAIANLRARSGGYPAWSAALWCAAGFVRQEMFIATLPLVVAAAWPTGSQPRRRRNMVVFLVLSSVSLTAIASQRYAATGSFSVFTRHGGSSVLGSYAPGAGLSWVDPMPFAAAVAPELLEPGAAPDAGGQNRQQAVNQRGTQLALSEILERPGFHLLRRLTGLFHSSSGPDDSLLYWSLTADGVQPAEKRDRAARFAAAARPWASWGLLLLHSLFLGALLFGLVRRDPAILVVSLAILFKAGIHMLVVFQARFFLVNCSLEALVVVLAVVRVVQEAGARSWFVAGTAAAGMVLVATNQFLPPLQAWIENEEWNRPLHYRFTLRAPRASMSCRMDQGQLIGLDGQRAVVRLARDPAPGEVAEVRCTLGRANSASAPLRLEASDSYAPGALPGRIAQEAWIDGVMVRRHDIGAEAWAGQWSVDIPEDAAEVSLRLVSLAPEPGAAWGFAAVTEIRLSERSR